MSKLSKEAVLAGLDAARRLRAGQLPTAAEIAAAPLLSGWVVQPLDGSLVRLFGVVEGHPIVPDGPCATSALLVMADDKSWARTVSRVYALGPSLNDLMSGRSSRQ